MTTLTATGTFDIIGAPTVTTEEVVVPVLPLSAAPVGTGRLIHPTLGTLDYPYSPDEWRNIDADVIVKPIIQHTQTLNGGATTIWNGHLKDVEVVERWTSDISAHINFVRTLINFWTNTPDPETAFIEWWPSYTTNLGFKVFITEIICGGQEVTLNYVTRQDWLEGDLEIKMRIVDRA